MLYEQMADRAPVLVDLALKQLQLTGPSECQAGFRLGACRRPGKLAGAGEDLQALLIGLGIAELVDVQKLLPLSSSRFDQGVGVGNASTKAQVAGMVQSSNASKAAG